MKSVNLILATLVAFTLVGAAWAIPEMMNLQGSLTDSTNQPVADGGYNITFRIYDVESGGNEVWSETVDDIAVSDGIFNVLLGSVNPLSADVFSEDNRWLGIQLEGEAEMSPRSRITSVGYSHRAARADTAEVALNGGESPWTVVHGGNSIVFENGSVGVNTDNPRERFQVGDQITIHDGGLKALGFNWYWDNLGQADRHMLDGPAGRLVFTHDGGLALQVAPSKDAEAPVDWITGMKLNNAGSMYTHRMITVDLRSHAGSAGRDGLHILASDDNNYGIIAVNKPAVHLWSSGENTRADLVGGNIEATGRVKCHVLEITGGADLAEPFPVSNDVELEPGSVVIIDEENPGRVKLGDQPYDYRVAGVISGADNIQPGIILTAKDRLDEGQRVALTGRVKVLVTAENGFIRPGDLLTTSSVPGHAMKATDPDRWPGAVIGKAMTPLTGSTGYVLALVNLQ